MARVIGIPSLLAKLESMQHEGQRMVGTALTSSAIEVKRRARDYVPKKTRNLQRSIHPDNLEEKGDNLTIDIGTDVEYAIWVEKGTSRWGGKPYLVPALNDSKPFTQRDVSRAMRAMLRAHSLGG